MSIDRSSLTEPTALIGLATGRPQPRGMLMRRLARKRSSEQKG